MITIRRNNTAVNAAKADLVAQERKTAITTVNTKIGAVRQRYITSIPGQDAIYAAKEAEALRYVALAEPPESLAAFPFIEAEIGVLAPTATLVAQTWLVMGDMWRVVAAQLERLRMTTINAITLATTRVEIDSLVSAFNEQLEQIQ